MIKRDIYVNTLLLEQDIREIGRSIAEIYQHMEILEVSRLSLAQKWEGAASRRLSGILLSEWEELERKRRRIEIWMSKLEQIQRIYLNGEKQAIETVMRLQI